MKSFTQFVAEQYTIYEDKLQSDIQSLKRIGWNLDKVTKHLITKSDEYGTKITSDLVKSYYSPEKTKAVKAPKPKKVLWPKDPPKSKINDPSHAEGYLNQAVDSEESPDIEGTEAYTLLQTAGYTDHAIHAVLKNMGWEAEYQKMTKTVPAIAKKTAPKRKFHESINEEKINGITAKKASISDRQKGESYTVYLKDTKKLIVSGITRASAIEITKSDDSKYAYASAEFFHDKINESFSMSLEGKQYSQLAKEISSKGAVTNSKNQSDMEEIKYKDYRYNSFGGGYSSFIMKISNGKTIWTVNQTIIGNKDKTSFDGISKEEFMKLKI